MPPRRRPPTLSRPAHRLATAATSLLLIASLGTHAAFAAGTLDAGAAPPVPAAPAGPLASDATEDHAGPAVDADPEAFAVPLTEREDLAEQLRQILLDYLTQPRHNHCEPFCICPPLC